MSPLEQLTRDAARASLYEEVTRFYARQMQLLDDGRVTEWAATFTADGVFAANARPEPTTGREAIENSARQATRLLADQGVQDRHWMGMVDVEQRNDGTVSARSYALIIRTPRGGPAGVHLSCTCDDVLVREDGRLLVSDRRVRRDDLPAAGDAEKG
jgi:3-phenylpropionate/cinnamic acid dioxygenase small subunit